MFYWQFCYPKWLKFTKIRRNWVPSGTSKSTKNRQKTMPVHSGDLLAAPGYPWMSQMATQGLKMLQTGIKNGAQTTHWDTIVIISMATKLGTGGRGGALRSCTCCLVELMSSEMLQICRGWTTITNVYKHTPPSKIYKWQTCEHEIIGKKTNDNNIYL